MSRTLSLRVTCAVQTSNPVHRRAVVAFIGFCIYCLGNGLLILALGRYENDHPVQTRACLFHVKLEYALNLGPAPFFGPNTLISVCFPSASFCNLIACCQCF